MQEYHYMVNGVKLVCTVTMRKSDNEGVPMYGQAEGQGGGRGERL